MSYYNDIKLKQKPNIRYTKYLHYIHNIPRTDDVTDVLFLL
jgi:hypothetical protein